MRDAPLLERIRPIYWSITLTTVALSSRLWGRDRTLWAFGAREGTAFADNAKYLYLHVADAHPEIRPVWISKNRRVVSSLQSRGYEAYHTRSLTGIAILLRAGAVFVTHGIVDVIPSAVGGATIVQLWHGVPIKTIGGDAERASYPRATRLADAYLAERVALATVPAEAAIDPMVSGLRIPRDRFRVTGYPRTDVFDHDVPGAHIGIDPELRERVRTLSDSGFVFAYLPTFRSWAADLGEQFDFDALEEFLAANDAYLLVKTHPSERLSIDEAGDRVIRLPPGTDVYPLLGYTDALITDYSSVGLDYLLLDRPIVYYPFDLDAYRERRGLYFEYESVTAGPIATDFESLLAGMRDVLEGDDFVDERRAVRSRFAQYPPGSASERVVRAVKSVLGIASR